MLGAELASIRAKAQARIQPQAEGGGALLSDIATTVADEPVDGAAQPQAPARMPDVGYSDVRTRLAKGREAGEESEMRDTYYRPGVPRRDV